MKFADLVLVAAVTAMFTMSLFMLVPQGNWIALGLLTFSSAALGAMVMDSLSNR